MKYNRRAGALLKLLAVGVLGAASLQASVIYSFTGTGMANAVTGTPAIPLSFELIVPDFVTLPTDTNPISFSCAQLVSSTNCGSAVLLSTQPALGTLSAQLQINAANSSGYLFFFPTGAFDSAGVYSAASPGSSGTLTVSVVAPEPTTSALMLAGLGLMSAFCLFKKRRSARG